MDLFYLQRRCAFLDEEAEESDDVEVSSDEEDDNLDALEGSFIDNATQPSHTGLFGDSLTFIYGLRNNFIFNMQMLMKCRECNQYKPLITD